MKISREDLKGAVQRGILSGQQEENLWQFLSGQSHTQVQAGFNLTNVIYYFGALIVMSAMGWFMTEAWQKFGGGGFMLVSIIYAIAFVFAGQSLWYNKDLKIPGGLLFTLAVWMTPLAIYGLQKMMGWWPQGNPGTYHNYHVWIKGSWFFMEIGTILAGIAALKFVRFPFLVFPIAFSLWYMSMDLTPLLVGKEDFAYQERLNVSLWFGLAMLIVAYVIDRRTKQDFAFWIYLFGMCAFWGGMSLMESNSELKKFTYFLINLALMMTSVFLNRRVFIIFGALGVFGYIGHLAGQVFKDSLMFPFSMTLFGLAVIYLGTKYHKYQASIEQMVLKTFPESLQRLRPIHRIN